MPLHLQPTRELLDQRLDDLHAQRTWLDVFPLSSLAGAVDMRKFWNHAVKVSRCWVRAWSWVGGREDGHFRQASAPPTCPLHV